MTTPATPRCFEGECGRCHRHVLDGEVCWYCDGCLCYDCWKIYGHCGHREAEEMNARGRGPQRLHPKGLVYYPVIGVPQ